VDSKWQNLAGTRKRLADISHHFLSEDSAGSKSLSQPSLLPVLLLDSVDQIWVVHVLAQALKARSRSSLVIYLNRLMDRHQSQNKEPDDTTGITIPFSRRDDRIKGGSVKERILDRIHVDHPEVEYAFVALTEEQMEALASFECMLLPVPATLDGIRRAYCVTKRMYQRGRVNIGIVMLGATDPAAARRYFDKLAVGALRFLGASLFYGGCLTAKNFAIDQGMEWAQGVTEVSEIADFILSQQLYSPVAGTVKRQ